MLRRFFVFALIFSATLLTVDLSDADATRRRGFFRNARVNRTANYRSARSNRASTIPYGRYSRSAIFDSFSGVYGHDGSYFVGR